jgi:putative membrane protein
MKQVNINVAFKMLLLFGFSTFFLLSIFTGMVSLYVHPRMIPYMIFASATMLFIALLLFNDLFKPTLEKTNSWSLLFFMIPLIMAFVLPATSFDANSGTIGDVQFSANTNNTFQNNQQLNNTEAAADNNSTIDSKDANETSKTEDSIPLQNGILVMDSKNFYHFLCEIYENLEQYKGTSIEVVGFVFKDNMYASNEFVPARLMMVCCAADMQPTGLLCHYEETSELVVNSWVKVRGVIDETIFDGEKIPCIIAQCVEKAEEPSEPYVYPY